MWGHRSERQLLEEVLKDLKEILELVRPRLVGIEIVFENQIMEGFTMSTAAVTLQVGQMTVATVVGFDQNGNPFTPVPTPSFAIDQPAVAAIAPDAVTPTSEDVTGVSAGIANLMAAVVNAAGVTLTATGVVTVTPAVGAPVLSSIQIQFSTPTTPLPVTAEVKRV